MIVPLRVLHQPNLSGLHPCQPRARGLQLAPPLAQHVLPKRLAGLDDFRVLVAESGGRQDLRELHRKLVVVLILRAGEGPQARRGPC